VSTDRPELFLKRLAARSHPAGARIETRLSLPQTENWGFLPWVNLALRASLQPGPIASGTLELDTKGSVPCANIMEEV